MLYVVVVFFFFKQKTAYEIRISDWSSDVCSSDLSAAPNLAAVGAALASAAIHSSQELPRPQACLQHRIDAFADRIHTPQKGSRLHIRLVPFAIADAAIHSAQQLLDGRFITQQSQGGKAFGRRNSS